MSDEVKVEAKTFSLKQQIIGSIVFVLASFTVIFLYQEKSLFDIFKSDYSLSVQLIIALIASLIFICVNKLVDRIWEKAGFNKEILESYSRFDLSGINPLIISICAGVAEEILFRAALQPLMGIWITSILFMLVHAQVYRFDSINKRVINQALYLFAISVVLGFIFEYVGLITVIIIHIIIDIDGLYSIRKSAIYKKIREGAN